MESCDVLRHVAVEEFESAYVHVVTILVGDYIDVLPEGLIEKLHDPSFTSG